MHSILTMGTIGKQTCKFLLIITLFSTLLPTQSKAQFYNGLQMDFGKNRVQYQEFYWTYLRFPKFDIYYDIDGRELAEYTAKLAEDKIAELESFFDHSLEKRMIFVVYNKHSDFKQSNIGLTTGSEQYNIGGVTRIIDNKVMLYFEGDHKSYEKQLAATVSEVVFTEMLYGGTLRNRVTSSTLINLPEWYFQGLVSYSAQDWNFEIENYVKDGILSGRYKKFNHLTGKDALYAGHSIWHFIAENYGKAVVSNIVYFTKINKNAETAFLYVLGSSLKSLSRQWRDYYIQKYEGEEAINSVLPTTKPVLRWPKKSRVYQQSKLSPKNNYLAYVTNEKGQYKIWLHDTLNHKRKRILKNEHKLDQLTDYSYPILQWHPSGKLLAYITEEEGKLYLYYYFPETKEMERRQLQELEKVLDFSFSHNGLQLVMSAVQKGQSDIYVYNPTSNTFEQLTNDLDDDLNPRFIDQSKRILFVSNRLSDTLNTRDKTNNMALIGDRNFDVFVYSYNPKSPVLKRLTRTPNTNETQPLKIATNQYIYLSDESGILNQHTLKVDSTISRIDTTIHYRFFTEKFPLTNYKRNIEAFDIAGSKKTEILFKEGRHRIYTQEFYKDSLLRQELPKTEYRKTLTNTQIEAQKRAQKQKEARKKRLSYLLNRKTRLQADSLLRAGLKPARVKTDSLIVNVNNYLFEQEKKQPDPLKQVTDSITMLSNQQQDKLEFPNARLYKTEFYTNHIVSQVDFSFLNASYQAFTGGPFYFNPGGNVLFKIGINDLFEDYRLIGGLRTSADLLSNEYLLSLENLKNRTDKQYIFHRQSFVEEVPTSGYIPAYRRVRTSELHYVMRYPFSQVSCVKTTLSARYDKNIPLINQYSMLSEEITYRTWVGLKGEYIFDNTLNLGLNLYSGTRYKIWGEMYKQTTGTNLWVVGADFRNYFKIHRNIIWANRIATSTSFGNAKLIYYLGAVDNWMNLSQRISLFDQSVDVDQTQNYAYQSVATNMRGFPQNIRNGNTFALLNSELRIPLIRYLANRPLNSDFFNNFQVVGFFDMGAAWTGLMPGSEKNAYDTETYTQGSVSMVVDLDRSPYVMGYGIGLRSRLFGYFIRTDWAWGIEGDVRVPQIFYLSLSLDF